VIRKNGGEAEGDGLNGGLRQPFEPCISRSASAPRWGFWMMRAATSSPGPRPWAVTARPVGPEVRVAHSDWALDSRGAHRRGKRSSASSAVSWRRSGILDDLDGVDNDAEGHGHGGDRKITGQPREDNAIAKIARRTACSEIGVGPGGRFAVDGRPVGAGRGTVTRRRKGNCITRAEVGEPLYCSTTSALGADPPQ
jgi:hypothetical protein